MIFNRNYWPNNNKEILQTTIEHKSFLAILQIAGLLGLSAIVIFYMTVFLIITQQKQLFMKLWLNLEVGAKHIINKKALCTQISDHVERKRLS